MNREFIKAITDGDIDGVVNILQSISQPKFEEMLSENNFGAVTFAASRGHFDVVRLLFQQASYSSGLIDRMLLARDCEAFREAAINGHTNIVRLLLEQASHSKELVDVMIGAWNFIAFRRAASNGHTDVVAFLLQQDNSADMLRYSDFAAFSLAAHGGHVNVVTLLLQHASTIGCLADMIRAADFAAFCWAADNNHTDILIFLLEQARSIGCLGDMLRSRSYAGLRRAVREFRTDVVRLLLNQASNVLELQDIYHEMTLIAGVRHNAVVAQRNRETDLREQAQNPESSMIHLTDIQQTQLAQAKQYYNERVNTPEKVMGVIQEIRAKLKEMYKQAPAKFRTGDGRTEVLPLKWADFQNLQPQYSADTREKMFQAYYAHEIHTLYRYFLEDNNWLASTGNFFIRFNDSGDRQSLFKDFIEPIAVAYLAATDSTMIGPNNYTPEDRLKVFITQMGDVARAHNRDGSADDMLGDKPSCSPGTLRRIFTAVIDHPLFIPLEEQIQHLINNKVREHFRETINADNCEALLLALKSCMEYPALEELEKINILDPTAEQITQYKAAVLEALKEQYRIHPAIIQYLNSQKAQHYIDRNLQLKVGMDCYAFQFATQTDLQGMLEDRVRVLQEERFIIRSERIESFSSKRTNEQTNPETKEELRKKRLKALRQKGIS